MHWIVRLLANIVIVEWIQYLKAKLPVSNIKKKAVSKSFISFQKDPLMTRIEDLYLFNNFSYSEWACQFYANPSKTTTYTACVS